MQHLSRDLKNGSQGVLGFFMLRVSQKYNAVQKTRNAS